MSQFTDREIQDLFTEAEKYALASQFPENTLNATNENVLSPPEDEVKEEEETDTPKQESSAESTPAKEPETDTPKQELEPVAAKEPEPAPVAPAPEIKPVQEKIEPDDGMLNQSDIDALIRATAPPAPAVASPPPPSVAVAEVVPPPVVNVQTSEQDEIMSADDIEALIRDAQAPTIAAAPMPSSETVAPQAETQSILHSSMDPDDDAPLSPEQIAALVEAANATTMDSDQDAVLSHDDIQALIAKTHKEIQVSTNDLFDTKESEIRIPEPAPAPPVAPAPKVTPAPVPAPAPSFSIGLETASQLDTETDAILSQSDLAEMMRKANLETESVKPAAVKELVADTYSADLEELIKKTESISQELSRLEEPKPLDGGKTQVDELIERRDRRQNEKMNKNTQSQDQNTNAPGFFTLAFRFIRNMAAVSVLGLLCGAGFRLYEFYQIPAPVIKSGLSEWKWEKNPDTRSTTKYRFYPDPDTNLRGTFSVRDASEAGTMEQLRSNLAAYYSTRYQNDYFSVADKYWGDEVFLVDYVFPHPSGQPDRGYIAKRSVFVMQNNKVYQLDFLAEVADRKFATPGQQVWQDFNRLVKQGLNLDTEVTTKPNEFQDTLVTLESLGSGI